MSRSRVIGVVILLVSLGAGVLSVVEMSRRVQAYNAQAHFGHFRFDVGNSRAFQAFGRDVTIDDAEKDGRSFLRVTYAGNEHMFPVVAPPAKNMPDLGIYGEWAKIIEVHEVDRGENGSLKDKPGSGRLVLICRITPEGFDPETWGSVRRSDWTFRFHEFKGDGTIETTQYRWPRSELGEMSLKKEIDAGDETAKALAQIEPLKERTWQYQAALHVIPKLNVPKYRFQDTAMKAMGWTLPVAGFCGLGVIVGIALTLAPKRVPAKDQDEVPTGPRTL